MEPDVIRMYSSSPPPMEDGVEEEDDEFGDFGTFSAVPNSISFTELETPTTFNQSQALTATSPPELINGRGVVLNHSSSNGTHCPSNDLSKANGVVPTSRPTCCPSERTEMKKVLSGSPDLAVSDTVSNDPIDCNGGGSEVLTNGFANSDTQQSPSSQTFVHCHITETPIEDTGSCPEDDFADFAAFSSTDRGLSQEANEDSEAPAEDSWGPGATDYKEHYNAEQQGTTSEDLVKDTHRTGADTSGPAEHKEGLCNTDRGSDEDSPQSEEMFALEHSGRRLSLNGVEEPKEENELSPDIAADCEAARSEEKSSGNETETETETETSFGRPLSTDALEEYGDVSTTGSAPSPPLPGDVATPADHSQLAEDDEDFGDFGDAGSFGGQGFADFEQLEVHQDQNQTESFPPAQDVGAEQEDDFGDFNSPKFHTEKDVDDGGGSFASFPVSDSFGNFNSAGDDEDDSDWNAFGGQQQEDGESWAAFSTEQTVAPTSDSRQEEVEDEEEEWHESEAPAFNIDTNRTDQESASLSGRLERLFQSSFPQIATQPLDDEVVSLRNVLEPPRVGTQGGEEEEEKQEQEGQPTSACNRYVSVGVWTQLQDIHEALGLRYQWGGSHCNKVLLCCLGIDTRNILFTGQKKQPVIVPMYAASLGMLEPTKEPVKPVSAAEMIASIGQAPPPAPESSPCPSDSTQEVLPPVQFDWSSSGLTNPLDASGGSSLLNLDFFGPVEDSGSTSSPSIPGVDPELYELTTAKLDPGSSGSRVADAFARLMSTMEKTSTSTRKPKKDENLSEEAAKVIAALPDLSFMQAKVLMFPATLTPLSSQATTD